MAPIPLMTIVYQHPSETAGPYPRNTNQKPQKQQLVDCNIEIGSVVGLGQSLVEVDMIRSPLINTPLQRGDLWGADLPTVSTVSHRLRGAKTVKTVAID